MTANDKLKAWFKELFTSRQRKLDYEQQEEDVLEALVEELNIDPKVVKLVSAEMWKPGTIAKKMKRLQEAQALITAINEPRSE